MVVTRFSPATGGTSTHAHTCLDACHELMDGQTARRAESSPLGGWVARQGRLQRAAHREVRLSPGPSLEAPPHASVTSSAPWDAQGERPVTRPDASDSDLEDAGCALKEVPAVLRTA